jgi:DNA-binding transcriptional LysR family regulator
MNTLHFRYAVEIEKTRSITQAAENLYMAQPNMSKAIKELENTLGITIFKRTSKGVIPTEQGMKFLEYARQILIQIDNMEAIQAPDHQKKQKLKISVPRSGYIYSAFSEFASTFDTINDIETYLHETNSVRTISNVREQSYDFGIIRFRTEHEKYFMDFLAEKNLESQLIWEFEMLAVMSEQNAPAECTSMKYNELCENFIEIAPGDESVPYLSAASAYIKSPNHKKIFVYDRGSQFDLLRTIPDSFTLDAPSPEDYLHRHELVQRKCEFENNIYKDILIYPASHTLTESELQFVNKLYEVRNKLAFGSFY